MLVMWPPECSSESRCLLSLVCLLALSHLLEILRLSKGTGEGGKEAERDLTALTASLLRIIFYKHPCRKEEGQDACTALPCCPQTRCSQGISGGVTFSRKGVVPPSPHF